MIPATFDCATGTGALLAKHAALMDMPVAAMNVPGVLALNTAKAQKAYQYGHDHGFTVLLGEKEGIAHNPANNYKVQGCIIQRKVLDYFLENKKIILPIVCGKDGRYWMADTHTAVACELIRPGSLVKDWPIIMAELHEDSAVIYDSHGQISHPRDLTDILARYCTQDTYPAGLVPYTVCDFMDDNQINEATFINHSYFPDK